MENLKEALGATKTECPFETAVSLLSGRWKAHILCHIWTGPKHFGELLRLIDGVSHQSLTRQLRDLGAAGIVQRDPKPGTVTYVAYSFTPVGETLRPVIQSLQDWGALYQQQVQDEDPIRDDAFVTADDQ